MRMIPLSIRIKTLKASERFETVCREVEPPQVDLAGHRFHCHVASRELERCGGDAAKTSVVMQAAITAATSDSTEPCSAV